MLYAKRGNIDAALEDLAAAIRLDPADDDPYVLRAELYIKKGDNDLAIADLTSATRVKPEYTVPYFNRALLYEQMGKLDLALADYDTLLRIAPGDAYYTGRRAALLKKSEREKPGSLWPWGSAEKPGSAAPTPAAPTPAPSETAPVPTATTEVPPSAPPPAEQRTDEPKPKQRASAGSGECRRFDAIANMTISVACPK